MDDTINGADVVFTGPLALLSLILGIVIVILPFWFIFSKAGYSKWLSLLMIIPLVSFILLYFLAFSKWPILKEKKQNIPPTPPLI